MTDRDLIAENQALRERIAQLEDGRAPVKVEVEGMEGLRQLSYAIETNRLDRFLLNKSVPDKQFWGSFWIIVIGAAVLVAVAYINAALT